MYKKIKKFFLLRIWVYDLKTLIQADYAKIFRCEIIDVAFAFRDFRNAVFEFFFGNPVYFAGFFNMRKLSVLIRIHIHIHIHIYISFRIYSFLEFI